jgi:hypothetical protein
VAKKMPARKARGAEAPTGELEVEDVSEAAPKPPAGIESWLVLITFAALVAAFVLINLKLRANFGAGWPV